MQPRKDAVLCAGWALFMLSVSIATWDRPAESILGDGGDTFMFCVGLLRMAAFAAGFFVAHVLSLRAACPSKALLTCSATLMIAGLVLAHAPEALLPLDGALLGLGSAFLFCAWQRVFARSCPDRAIPLLGVASAVGAAMVLPLSAVGYLGSAVDLSAAAGLVSLAVCVVSSGREDLLLDDVVEAEGGRSAGFIPWKSVLCVGACAFIWQLVFALGLKDVGALVDIQMPFVVCQTLAAAVLVLVWMRMERVPDAEAAFIPSFAVLTTGFLLMPFLGTWFRIGFTAATLLVFCLMSVLMQGACIAAAQREGTDPSAVLGRFAGVVYIFMALGYAAGGAVQASGELTVVHVLILALVMTYALGLVLFLVRGHTPSKAEASPDVPVPNEADAVDTHDAAVGSLARQAGLTERETEVLGLVVKGRDLPFIAEKLCLSKNTVRTHTRNIYRKLDVHSRQDVIDLIEGGGA